VPTQPPSGPVRSDPPGTGPRPAPATLGQLLARQVAARPDSDVLVVDHSRLTYGELDASSAVLARQLLAAGIGKGSRVGLLFPNDARFVTTLFAITRIGAVAVPLSTFATPAELAGTTRHADLSLVITADRFLAHDYVARWEAAFPEVASGAPYALVQAPFLRELWVWGEHVPTWARRVDLAGEATGAVVPGPAVLAAAEAEVHGDDPVAIIYTSGSTSLPKGVVHGHRGFVRQAAKQAESRGLGPDDRLYSPMPFFWVGGLTVILLASVHAGATVLGSMQLDPDVVLDVLEREGATSFFGWVHLARALEAAPTFPRRDLSRLRHGNMYGALPPDQRPRDPSLMCDGLGMTETAGPHTHGQFDELPEHLRGSFGTPAPGMQHRVVDPGSRQPLADGRTGELQVRGDALMLGLHKQDRQTYLDDDGWYSTGDLAHLRGGHVFFEGRLDDMIKARGTNVSPREVEAVIAGLSGVASAFVTGVTDDAGLTEVGAVVVTTGGDLTAQDVIAHARQALSSYKVPRHVVLLPAAQLPMTSSTKVDRRALVRLLQEAVTS
jgi:acyl-CoA synthetase (AMP-forming)/AMP-acid ligase II